MIETDNSIAGPTTNPSLVCNSHKSFRYFQIYIWNSYLCWAFVRLSQKSLNRITCACVWYIKNYTKHFIGEEIFDTFEFYISPECEMTTVDSAWYKCFKKMWIQKTGFTWWAHIDTYIAHSALFIFYLWFVWSHFKKVPWISPLLFVLIQGRPG